VQKRLTNAVLGALGIGGDTNTPTNASSPSMVNIANQGVVTGANFIAPAVPDEGESTPSNAGSQNT
jgi:hypothetical protein